MGNAGPDSRSITPARQRGRTIALALLALVYLLAGVAHCLYPRVFIGVTPAWVPHTRAVIIATGLCEIFGAIGLLIGRTRVLAGIMLALYALCVYPANIEHAVRDLSTGTGLGWAYHYPRLFAQPLICWWALWASGAIGRSFGRAARAS